MSTLSPLPAWLEKVLEHRLNFTPVGLNGLLDHHGVTNSLGELLAQGIVTPGAFKAWLDDQKSQQVPPPATTNLLDPWAAYHSDPRAFWEQCLETILGRKLEISAIPKMRGKTKKAIEKYKLMLVFLPVITEEDYPKSFVKPIWGLYINASQIERKPLPGRWVLAETIRKPDWDDPNGYGEDPLGKDLGLTTRFKISWGHITMTIMPAVGKLYGLSRRATRHSTAEEWNLIGNLFVWLNANRNMDLPDLGSTNSWEWCLNACGSGRRFIVGHRVTGGLSDMDRFWSSNPHDGVGFRLLGVL